MGLPPKKKTTESVTKPTINGKVNDVCVKISRRNCIELIAMAANIYDKKKDVNRLIFPAQAIRTIRQQYTLLAQNKYKDYEVVITLLLLNALPSYYTAQQENAIKNSVAKIKQDYPMTQISTIRLFTIKTMAELIDYVNRGNQHVRHLYPIGRIDLFAHGHDGDISLGYNLDDHIDDGHGGITTVENKFLATKDTFLQWNASAFHQSAEFYSWACRTGAPIKNDTQKRSLAYYIAKHLNIPVYGFIRRSDYANTWGNSEDRRYLQLQCWKILPDALQNAEKCKRLRKKDKERENYRREIGTIWMENGAIYPVCSGTSPKDLPAGYYLFTANSIQTKLVKQI